MKYLLLLVLFTLSAQFVNSQGWMWAKHFTGTGQNIPTSMVSDASGNVFVYGNFSGTVNQDALTLTALGGNDMFVAKYNNQGQIVWLKQMGGTGGDVPTSIALSNDGNYFYISGVTNSNPCIFNGNNMTTLGGSDAFIAKYSIDGNLQWVHNAGYGALNQLNGNLIVDNSDNLIFVGAFLTDITFYGGTTTLTSPDPAVRQNFISKFDSNGNLLWAKMISGDNSTTTLRNASTTTSGYYFSGQFTGSLLLDIGTVTSSGLNDGFLYKTDLNGNGVLVRKIAGTGDEVLWKHKSDANGYQYLTGYFSSPYLNIDSTATVASLNNTTNKGGNDIFYMCYSPNGTLQWVKSVGSTTDDAAYNMDIVNGKSLLTGSYGGSISFDNITLTNNGASDAFIAECSAAGQFTSAYGATGKLNDAGKACNYSPTGRSFVVAGEFYSDTLTISTNHFVNPSTFRDAFIVKYGCFESLSFVTTPVSCFGGANGTVSVTPSQGNEPYTYLWSTGATTAAVSGLSAGNYTVTVSGTNGCSIVGNTTVIQPTALISNTSQLNVSCNGGNNGTATINVSGGTPSYTYLWNDPAPVQTTANCTGLLAGVWSVTVTDANGCTNSKTITITEPAIALTTSVSQVNVSCNGGNTGSATVSVSGGTPPYMYLWNDPAPAQTTATCTGLTAGTWSVTVADANGCTTINTVTITQPAIPLTSSITSQTNIICNGGATGSATVTAGGGTPSYSYLWNDPAPAQTSATCSALTAGTWVVTVTDNNGCTTTSSVTITQPIALSATIQSTPPVCINNGTARVIPANGTSPYTYLWSTGSTAQTISGLSFGITYSVTIKDACNATVVQSVVFSPPVALSITSLTGCYTTNNTGSATVAASGGNLPYTYSWNTTPVQTGITATGLGPVTLPPSHQIKVTVKDFCNNSVKKKIKLKDCVVLAPVSERSPFDHSYGVSIYPNPAFDQISVLISNEEEYYESTEINMKIFNVLGKLISSENIKVLYGEPIYKDVTGFSPGLYMITIDNGVNRETQRLLIQR